MEIKRGWTLVSTPRRLAAFLTKIGLGEKKMVDPIAHVFLDVGHFPNEGAVGLKGAREVLLNVLQGDVLQRRLTAAGFGADVPPTPPRNLVARGMAGKDKDLFISLHHNAYAHDDDPGTEVFLPSDAGPEAVLLAAAICDAICAVLYTKNRGVKRKNWTVIKTAHDCGAGIAILVESYFIDHYTQEEANVRSEKAANAIADAIIKHYGKK
jgi:N-acetylmuramoyl-L-alanine amidase